MSLFSDSKISADLIKAVRDVMTKKPVEEMSKDMAYATGTKKAMQSTGDKPPLDKSTIKMAHKIAKGILKKEEVEQTDEAVRVKDISVSNTLGSLKKAKPGAHFIAKDHARITRSIAAKDVRDIRKKTKGNPEARKAALKRADYAVTKEEENAPSKANGGIAHNCASHVKHATYGEGLCIPEMHTILETEDGQGYVTHYDVMFTGEDGPYIIEDVSVEELEIIAEKKHRHPTNEAKKDKGDMDKDGKHEPDDVEYMHNKDKAIKAAMAKKKG